MRVCGLFSGGFLRSAVTLAGVLVALAACGDDKQGIVNIIDGEDAVGDTLEGPCDEGDRACSGQTPVSCVAGAWVLDDEACTGTTPWCLDGGCVACSPGTIGCGANTPRTCGDDGAWIYDEACPAEQPLCLDGGCVQCSPGQQRCHPEGTSIQVCDELGQWMSETACDFGCSDARCGGTCVPGQGRCEFSVPSTCDVTGTWIEAAECTGEAALCLDGACVECSPGAVDCNGQERRTCSVTGMWEVTETCEFACVDGGCTGVCVPDSVGCDARVPQTCDANGQWVLAVSECAYGCAAGECFGECRPETERCFGDAPATCGADSIWQTEALCPQPTPDCNIGGCYCSPAKTLCNGDTLCTNLKTDPLNCGSCGHDCLGGLCENGLCKPTILASAQIYPACLVVDDTHVYWTNFAAGQSNAGHIRSIPKVGGVISSLASEVNSPSFIAASDTDLFWTTGPSGNVQTTPKTGGNIVNLVTAATGPAGIVFGDDTVYYASANNGFLYSVPPTGGVVTTLTGGGFSILGLGFDGDYLYWANGHFGNPNSTIMRIRRDGTAVAEVFAANQSRPTAIAFDDTHVYWTAWNGNGADAIRRCPKTGCVGGAQNVVEGQQFSGALNATCFTVDATHVYWTSAATGTIQRIPKGGGTPTVLATSQPGANCVQDDATAIYWTNFTGGNIMKLAK